MNIESVCCSRVDSLVPTLGAVFLWLLVYYVQVIFVRFPIEGFSQPQIMELNSGVGPQFELPNLGQNCKTYPAAGHSLAAGSIPACAGFATSSVGRPWKSSSPIHEATLLPIHAGRMIQAGVISSPVYKACSIYAPLPPLFPLLPNAVPL